jgi:CDP-paratose 2-epimerase
MLEASTGRPIDARYVDQHRMGDHICYISDLRKLRADYPTWGLAVVAGPL